jgi:hypothetical protein
VIKVSAVSAARLDFLVYRARPEQTVNQESPVALVNPVKLVRLDRPAALVWRGRRVRVGSRVSRGSAVRKVKSD